MSKIAEAFNWAATPPERPFTLMNEFNRIAGNPEYGGFKFGRGARIVERAVMGLTFLTLAAGTTAAIVGVIPGATVTAGSVVLGLAVAKGLATAAAALTEGVVKVGNALAKQTAGKKVGAGPTGPTP